jgi:hypothetical protein
MALRLESLFPLPLGVFDYPDPEGARIRVLDWVKESPQRYIQNEANLTLEDFALHTQPCMAGLVPFFLTSLGAFMDAMGFELPEMAITQCWLNVNRPGDRHHRHHHPNSYISGVYYLDASPDCGAIAFHRPGLVELQPARTRGTPFTFDLWREVPRSGQLLLFPSRLEHSVEPNLSTRDRLSISFNTMFRGAVGSHLQRVDFGR